MRNPGWRGEGGRSVHELLYRPTGHAEHGDEAKLLAGGHSLLPMMKVRPGPPGFFVNVGHLDELRCLRREGVAVGALTRHPNLVTQSWCGNPSPLLGLVASHIGDPQAGTAAPSAVPWRTRTRLRTCTPDKDYRWHLTRVLTRQALVAAQRG